MEANRPTPTDLSQFAVGETRPQIVNIIGTPAAQRQDGTQSCDIYKLYTRGPNNVGKVAIVTSEVTADIFTLGMAEVIATPIEATTRNKKHTVTFCYGTDGKLITMNDGGASHQ
jgi:outer membrane protein assembly factor BamE (lipoprotein component of BamABCDE complex)